MELARLHPPLHWHDIGLDKTAIGIDIEPREAHFCPGRPTRLSKIILDKHSHWPSHLWLRFPFVSSRNLKFAHGPAVDKFCIQEIVKIAIRAPNPEIGPRMHYLVFETSI